MISIFRPRAYETITCLAALLTVFGAGCGPVAGNYPPSRLASTSFTASFEGSGYRLLAGPRLRLDKVRADLAGLGDQGYSRYDPQIIKSVARRNEVPPALVADRSGSAYYRVRVLMDPGVALTLESGALELTVATEDGVVVLHDQGFLLEDRRLPEGCRKPAGPTLALGSPASGRNQVGKILVRLPVRGDIVALDIVPDRLQKLPSP